MLKQDIDIPAGDSMRFPLSLTDQDSSTLVTAGGSLVFEAAQLGQSPIVITVDGGVGYLEFVPADTSSRSGVYHYTLKFTDASGNVSTLTAGRVTIKQLLRGQ